MTLSKDMDYMRHALNLARRGLGFTAPNPSVGCVIVKGGVVIAAAHTAKGGRPHAETIALEKAGAAAKGASVYVSLEPCAHHGKTPPCAQALIDAQVAKVIVGCGDPDPRVAGQGIAMLRDAGIEVIEGLLGDEACHLNAGFFNRITKNRPWVTCKLAVSKDGKIASGKGKCTQISGDLAQRFMHFQRSKHDAILIGSETYLSDAPRLTTRLEGVQHEPLKVILDRRGRIKDADGFEVLAHEEIKSVLSHLAEKGITRLLVEGGAEIHKSFLESGCVDEFQLCQSPITLGENGVEGLSAEQISEISGLKHAKSRILGEDKLEIYRR